MHRFGSALKSLVIFGSETDSGELPIISNDYVGHRETESCLQENERSEEGSLSNFLG